MRFQCARRRKEKGEKEKGRRGNDLSDRSGDDRDEEWAGVGICFGA